MSQEDATIQSVKKSYAKLSEEIFKVENMAIPEASDDETRRLVESTKKIAESIGGNIGKSVKELERLAEWNKIIMSFYGETNAGKSTIIEILKIVFHEQQRAARIAELEGIIKKLGLSPDGILKYRDEIQKLSIEIDSIQKNAEKNEEKRKMEREILEKKLDQLGLKIKMSGFFARIVVFLHIGEDSKKIRRLIEEIKNITAVAKKDIKNKEQKVMALSIDIKEKQKKVDEAIAIFDNKRGLFDGSTIGDGRSDYTTSSCVYNMRSANVEFQVIDVPGIEGDENAVKDEILRALKSSHLIFYVTNRPAPPQSGSRHTQGVIEKIKEQISDQSEIWTIFNKRITNPMGLKSELVSADEKNGLTELDHLMSTFFGEAYKGSMSISALPAFLSVAKYLPVDSNMSAMRRKFFTQFANDSIFELTGLGEYVRKVNKLASMDVRQRVIRANYRKLEHLVQAEKIKIEAALKNEVIPGYNKILKQETSLLAQLKSLRVAYGSDTLRIIDSTLSDHLEIVRDRIFNRIEGNISNDQLKSLLKTYIEESLERVRSDLDEKLEDYAKVLEQKFVEIIRRSQDLGKETLREMLSSVNFEGFVLNLELSIEGIDYVSLGASVVGGILLFWNPAGWLSIIGGVVSVIAGAYKAVRSFFSKEYKRSQQREAAIENIENVKSMIHDRLSPLIKKASNEIQDIIDREEPNLTMGSRSLKIAQEYLTSLDEALSSFLEGNSVNISEPRKTQFTQVSYSWNQ